MSREELKMTSASPESDPRQSLVPVARRPMPVIRILGVPLFGAVYLMAAMYHPILGPARLGVLVLTVLAMIAFAYAVMSTNADILSPMRVVSVYFLIIFCLTPLAADGLRWHYTRPFHELLLGPALYCLGVYVTILAGYHLPFFGGLPDRVVKRRSSPASQATATRLAIVLFIVGFLSWVVLVTLTGGAEGLVYSDRTRGEFFIGFGHFFWGAIFMYPGATLYWAARLERGGKFPWAQMWILVLTFSCFLTLQGRMRALNILILGIFIAHYLYRPIRPTRLGLFAVSGLLLALIVGVARAPSVRAFAFENPTAFLIDIASNLEEGARGVLFGDLSRLRQIVLIMDKIPSWMDYDWGISFVGFLNPFVRIIGMGHLELPTIGPRLFLLAHPEFPLMPTGYLPSIVGEMIVNFPWFLALPMFLLYGAVLRWSYTALIIRRGDFISVTIYCALLLQLANMLLQSLGHVIFELTLVVVPLFLIRRLAMPPDTEPLRFPEESAVRQPG